MDQLPWHTISKIVFANFLPNQGGRTRFARTIDSLNRSRFLNGRQFLQRRRLEGTDIKPIDLVDR
jgi:hypothetical protein